MTDCMYKGVWVKNDEVMFGYVCDACATVVESEGDQEEPV